MKFLLTNNFLYMYIFISATKAIPTYVNFYFLTITPVKKYVTPKKYVFQQNNLY